MDGKEIKNQTDFNKIPEILYSDSPDDPNNNIEQNQNDIPKKEFNEETSLMKELYSNSNPENNIPSSIAEKNLATSEDKSNENSGAINQNKENNNRITENQREESVQSEQSFKISIIPKNREDYADLMSFYGQNNEIEKVVQNFQCGEFEEYSILQEDYLEVVELCEIDDETFKQITYSEIGDLKKAKEYVEHLDYEGKIISKISDMDYLLLKAQNVNDNNRQIIKKKLESNNDYIYVWREILPGPDSFFRSIMFSFLEELILSRNKNMFRIFIYEFNNNLEDDYFKKIMKFYEIEPYRAKIYLILIYSILFSDENTGAEKAHSFFIKVYNSDINFDPLLILNLKFLIFKYLKENENRIYTQEYNSKVGNLLPTPYKVGGNYNFKKFYQNNLLQLGQTVAKISLMVIPFILRRDLFIYNFDGNDINHLWIHTDGKENKDFLPIRLFFFNDSYFVIYSKNYYFQFQNIFNIYSDFPNNTVVNKNNISKNIISKNILDSIDNIDEKSIKNSKIPLNEIPSFIKKENSKEANNNNFNIDKNTEVNNSLNNQVPDVTQNHKLNENMNVNTTNNFNNKGNINTNIINNFNNNYNINVNNNNGKNNMNSKENNVNNQNNSKCNTNVNNNNNYVLKKQTNKVENDIVSNKNIYINNNNHSNKVNINLGENNNGDNYNNMNYKINYRNTNNFQGYNPKSNNINNNMNGINTYNMNNINFNSPKTMVNNTNHNKNNNNNLDDNNQNKNIINNINNINNYNNNQLNVGTANENANLIRRKSQETNMNTNNITKNPTLKDTIQKLPTSTTFNKNNYYKVFGNSNINNNINNTTNIYCPGCKGLGKNGFYCEKCCLDILIKKMRYSYIDFIKYNISNLRNDKLIEFLPNFISNLYIDFPNNVRKKFSEVYYLLTDMNKNVFNSKLNLFKSSLCLGCFNYIKCEPQYIQNEKGIVVKNPFLFKFPCGCIFCSDTCLNRFLEHIPFEKKKAFICACGEEYNCIKLKYLLYFALSHNLMSFRKEILRILYDYMKNKCCICYIEVPLVQGKKSNFNIYEIKDDEIDQIFKINKFNHLVCNKCVKRDISKKKVFYCKMCSSEHYILYQKNIDGQIKTNCNIF